MKVEMHRVTSVEIEKVTVRPDTSETFYTYDVVFKSGDEELKVIAYAEAPVEITRKPDRRLPE